jgi:CRP/FNR family transcriptional regulator
MRTPYGLEITENCLQCKMRSQNTFCDLSHAALQAFDLIKFPTAYPKGAVLFVEGQNPRGVYVLCKGQIKLSLCSSTGKVLIMRVAEPGEILGLSATITGKPYGVMAETAEPCQITFIRREDFLRFLREHSEAGIRVVQQLSEKYLSTCSEIRTLSLSQSSSERLAKLLLDWGPIHDQAAKTNPRILLRLSHEEIGQKIGTSRETVTRQLAAWKKRKIVQRNGSVLLVRNMAALKAMAAS